MKRGIEPHDVMMWTLVIAFVVLCATACIALGIELWRYAR